MASTNDDSLARQRRLERRLLDRWCRERTPQSRDEVVECFSGLARAIARRYAARHRDQEEDLFQVGMIGLLKALDRFDPERGTPFVTFALPTISGEIRRHLRDHSWAVRPPRDLQERALKLMRARDELTSSLGRAPTVAELGDELGLEEDETLEGLMAARSGHAVSLDTPTASEDDAPSAGLHGRLAFEERGFDAVLERLQLEALGRALPQRERMILRLRFEEDLTQTEIGVRLGLSQMHVSRLLRRSLDTMRADC